MSNKFSNVPSLLYLGTRATQPPNMLFLKDRDPNQYDNQHVSIGDLCLREDTQDLWYLGSLAGTPDSQGILANWIPFGAGGGGLTSLEADDLVVAVPAGGIIKTSGNGINLFTTAFGTPNETVMHLKNIGPVDGTPGVVISTENVGTQEDTLTSVQGVEGDVLTIQGGNIVFAAPGVGGTVTQVTADRNLEINPATNINLDPEVWLKQSIQQPDTNVAGTTGVYALGTAALPAGYASDRFLHAAGAVSNTFVGRQSGRLAMTGTNDVGVGVNVLDALTTGSSNVAIGKDGLGALLTGSNNSAIGANSGSAYVGAESNNVLLNSIGTAGDSGVIRIGTNAVQTSAFFAGIYGVFPPTNAPRIVTVNSNNQLQTVGSGTSGYVLTLVGTIPQWQPAGGGGGGNVFEGQNINITAPLSTINLNTSIHLLNTTADGRTGVIALGPTAIPNGAPVGTVYVDERFIHAYGTQNTFVGLEAGNMTLNVGLAIQNTGIGTQALRSVTTGHNNTCVGSLSGDALTIAQYCTFVGRLSGTNVTSGDANTLIGAGCGVALTTGDRNTIIGRFAANGTGATSSDNVLIGIEAGLFNFVANFNVIIGATATTHMRGDYNVIIGNNAGNAITNTAPGTNSNIYISHDGVDHEESTIRIGTEGTGNGEQDRAFMAGIYNQNTVVGTNRVVIVNSPGQLRTITAGTPGQVLTMVGTTPQWQPAGGGGGGGGTIITPFTSNGTWVKNVNTKFVTVIGWNGGSGGGSGSRPQGSLTDGGQGGGAGGVFFLTMPAFMFGASETVIIGTGGIGGAPSVTNFGNDGTEGTNTTIGWLGCPTPSQDKGSDTVIGGGGGANAYKSLIPTHGIGSPVITETFGNYYQQSQNSADFHGSVGFGGGWVSNTGLKALPGQSVGLNNGFGTTQPINNQATRYYAMLAASGGGGGGMRTAASGSVGLIGGGGGNVVNSAFYNVGTATTFIILAGGAGGAVSGAAGGNGNPSITNPLINPTGAGRHGFLCGGTGGGGGALGQGVNGGTGGNGGFPGGGGGGGGGCTAGFTSGAGGNGSAGYLIVIEQS